MLFGVVLIMCGVWGIIVCLSLFKFSLYLPLSGQVMWERVPRGLGMSPGLGWLTEGAGLPTYHRLRVNWG